MNKTILVMTLLLGATASAEDFCETKAQKAAAKAHADPGDTKIEKVIRPGSRYVVAAGLGWGAANYYVDFPNGCTEEAVATRVPYIPASPYQLLAQQAYNTLINSKKEYPTESLISEDKLPADVKTYLANRRKNPEIKTVWAYEVTLRPGEIPVKTYGFIFEFEHFNGFRAGFSVVDAHGETIDFGTIDNPSYSGFLNSISWQGLTVEEEWH